MTAEPTDAPPACPRCGGASVPIVYGRAGRAAFERAERGEIVLGGCMVGPGSPRRRCSACGRDFGGTHDDRDAPSPERP